MLTTPRPLANSRLQYSNYTPALPLPWLGYASSPGQIKGEVPIVTQRLQPAAIIINRDAGGISMTRISEQIHRRYRPGADSPVVRRAVSSSPRWPR